MPLSVQPVAPRRVHTLHLWGLDKSGKTQMALSAPKPAFINFDRNADFLLDKMGLGEILRDRITAPIKGIIKPPEAKRMLNAFETDIDQAVSLAQGGACETIIVDGGTQLLDIVTIVTLDESENKNNTYKYAGRNSWVRNFFNRMNEEGLNLVWTSKAKPLWVGDKKVPNEYVPDCHDDIPFMVDVNVQMRADRKPGVGVLYAGIIGTNAFNGDLTGAAIPDMTWDVLFGLLRPIEGGTDADTTGQPTA